jgi:hypothetical protein
MVELIDQEQETEEIGAAPVTPPSRKSRQSFSRVKRELSDEELSSPAVQKLLIEEIERLESDNDALSVYREKFYESDKKKAILEEKLQKNIANDIIFGACLTVGSAALGYAPSLWASQPSGQIALIFGVVLILGGIASRFIKQ